MSNTTPYSLEDWALVQRGNLTNKERMRLQRQAMPQQPPEERVKNFQEVALGYTPEQALIEANRCIMCDKPTCIDGCPVVIKIPDFIRLIQEGKIIEAAEKILEDDCLPAMTGRVCPQETQCEETCVLAKTKKPIAIGRLERYAADYYIKHGDLTKDLRPKAKTGKQVAVVGSGPAGLTTAGELAKLGYEVTLFEALHKTGGVLIYGIPEFRLPKQIVAIEVERLRHMGVKIITNAIVGKISTIDELLASEGFDAVFLGTGAGLPHFMKIPGENLMGVYSANEYLTRVNLMAGYDFPNHITPVKIGKKVAVIGGGNTAMDAIRISKRLGAEEASIFYRRSREEMPARTEEVENAEAEGIKFYFLVTPVEILGNKDGWVRAMRLQKMALGEPDQSGRRRPVPIEGSEYEVPIDNVIMAVGQSPNPLIQSTTPDLKTTKWGTIVVDEKTFLTSKTGVYAGGDVVTGGATVILAMGAGKTAAFAIHDYLSNKK